MSLQTHGLTIGIERIGQQIYMVLTAKGTLTHEDYQLITPMLENALSGLSQPKINCLIDAEHLTGWEARAAWDDFKLGVKHGQQFNKIAIFGHKKWQEYAAKMGSWFIGGEARFFEEKSAAIQWLND